MKQLIIVTAFAIGLSSCSTIHKLKDSHKIAVATKSDTKRDSTATKHIDSTSAVKTVATHTSHTVSGYDTLIAVGADSSTIIALVPDTGHTETFVDGDNVIQVGVDTNGKLTVKTHTQAKLIPVHANTTTDIYDTKNTDAQTKVVSTATDHVKSLAKVDSTRHEKTVSKSKVVSSLGAWWMWLILILIIVVYIAYKCYSKGSNPLKWFV